MFSTNKYTKRITSLLLILLFLIPINIIFLRINNNSNIDEKNSIENDFIDEDIENPKTSLITLNAFKINDSTIYEDGTFYLYQEEYLYFTFENITDVDNVHVQILGTVVNNDLAYLGSNLWDYGPVQFDIAVSKYQGILTYENRTNPTQITYFGFSIQIYKPALLIPRLWGKDTISTTYREIPEGGIYSVYRDTSIDIELKAETMNKGGAPDDVYIDYNDGIQDISNNFDFDITSGSKHNFTFENPKMITIYIDTDAGEESRWKQSNNLYKVLLNASDADDYYLFEFYIEVKNKPPQITQFDLSQSIIESPSGSTTNLTIRVNATDPEDDLVYFNGQDRFVRYTDPTSGVSAKAGCDVLYNPGISGLKNKGISYYELNFTDEGEGEFLIELEINEEINMSFYEGFEINFTLSSLVYNRSGGGSPVSMILSTGSAEIFDHVNGEWDHFANLTHLPETPSFITVSNSSNLLASNIADYIPQNRTVLFRISINESLPVNYSVKVYFDYIEITSTVMRRTTFSRVLLTVVNPTATAFEHIELINYWDNQSGVYYYTYQIDNQLYNYGSWTIEIRFIDHGNATFADEFWSKFYDSKLLPKISGSKNIDINDEQYGQAVATRIFALGISQAEALNISSSPIYNTTLTPNYDETTEFSIIVDGIDSTNLDYKTFNRRVKTACTYIHKNFTLMDSIGVFGINFNSSVFITEPPVANYSYLNYIDSYYYNFTIYNNTIGYFEVFFKIATEDINSILSLEPIIRVQDNYGALFDTGKAEIYDHTNLEWDNFADLRNIPSTFQTISNIYTNPNDISDYIENTFKYIRMKFTYGYIDYTNINYTSISIDLVKAETIVNYSGFLTGDISEPFIETGSSNINMTDYDDVALNISLISNSSEYYHSVKFCHQLETRPDIIKENITAIYIEINNWYNTTQDINDVYIEFWNYSSKTWILLSGSWHGSAALETTLHDQLFTGVITNVDDISDLLDINSILGMRIRLERNSGTTRDYKISIDFVNVTVDYTYYYEATLNMWGASSMGQELTTLKLTPIDIAQPLKIKYVATINFTELGLYADTFTFSIIIRNGNSSIGFTNYRKAPHVITRQQIFGDRTFVGYYYYDPTEEILDISKNYTISVTESIITVNYDLTLKRAGSSDRDSIIFIQNIHTLNCTVVADFGDYTKANDNFNLEFQIKKGTKTSRNDWETFIATNVINTTKWRFTKAIDDSDNFDSYYVRLYTRSPNGQEHITEWRKFRIQNFQPLDFDFDFDNGVQQSISRGGIYSFTFKFRDYDLSVDDHRDKITIKFQIYDKVLKTNVWLDATCTVWNGRDLSYFHSYNYRVDIPDTIFTGTFEAFYYNWTFLVNDTNMGYQSQLSYLAYNGTNFRVTNAAPSISPLYVNGQGSGYNLNRYNNLKITFNISDSDDKSIGMNPALSNVIYFNISNPSSGILVSVDNSSIDYIGGYREYNYFIDRDADVETYTVDIRVNDSDGRETSSSIQFNVRNNAPQITAVNLTNPDLNNLYRNIVGVSKVYDPVKIYVNISDVEDSWLLNNYTDGYNPYVELSHREPYGSKISSLSGYGNLEPIHLDLTALYPGNSSNGHVETWWTEYQFNNTAQAKKFYAGEIVITIYVNDSYDAGGQLSVNSVDDADPIISGLESIYIRNWAPELLRDTEINNDEIDMDEQEAFYFEIEANLGDEIDFYIFANDTESLSHIIIYFYPLISGQFDYIISIRFDLDNWEKKMIEGVETYVCTYDTNDLDDYVDEMEIKSIEIWDDDAGFKHNTDYGKTFDERDNLGIIITIKGAAIPPPAFPWVIVFIIIGAIMLLGVVIVVGVMKYRKKSGWRKFLD